MSLNLTETAGPSPYIEAVNDARFVRTYGIISLLGSILVFIGGGVVIGIGLAIMGFGSGRYYRALGLVVALIGFLGFLFGPFRIIAPIVLGAGIAWKGKQILDVLAKDGKEDADWQVTRSRTLTGIVVSLIGLVLGLGWLGLLLVGLHNG